MAYEAEEKEDMENDLGHKWGVFPIYKHSCACCPDGQHGFHRAALLILLSLQYAVRFTSASGWELTT